MDPQINRARELWYNWEKKEMELSGIPELSDEHGRDITRQKYAYLRQGIYRLSGDPTRAERLYLDMISVVTAKLERQLYPNPLVRAFVRLKAQFYDRPKALASHQQLTGENQSRLKAQLRARGLGKLTEEMASYLDYQRERVTIPMSGQMDRHKTVSLHQHLELDGKGQYQLAAMELTLKDALAPGPDLKVRLEKDCPLHSEQIGNFLLGKPVYLPAQQGPEQATGTWIALNQDGEQPDQQVARYGPEYGYELKAQLQQLAIETGIYAITSARVLSELEQGNSCLFCGRHPRDQPFQLSADPAAKSLRLANDSGGTLSREELIGSLKHERSPDISQDQSQAQQQQTVPGQDPDQQKSQAGENNKDQGLMI